MKKKTKENRLTTVLLVIVALVLADLLFNDGRALASITTNTNAPTTALNNAVQGQQLNNAVMPQPTAVQAPTAPPAFPGVTFTVIDDGDLPQINDMVPVLSSAPTQQPESIINWSEELSKPTATPRTLTDEQLLACLNAQMDGRRMAPYCPPDPGAAVGEGR